MSTAPFKITLREFCRPGQQTRFLVLVAGQCVAYAPRSTGKGLGTTAPGTAMWVLSSHSKALGRIEEQLKAGARLLVPCPPEEQQEALVWDKLALLSPAEIEKHLALSRAIDTRKDAQRREKAAQAAKKKALKAAVGQLSPDQMDEILALIQGGEAKAAKG